jgi:hypothetical protein
METFKKKFELQIDEKPNGCVIRLNDDKGCILRICGVPKKLVYKGAEIREFIDISFNRESNDNICQGFDGNCKLYLSDEFGCHDCGIFHRNK